MFKKLLTLSTLLFSLTCLSQNLVLQGQLVDENNSPIAFANIVLLENNLVVNGAISNDNGFFKMEQLKASTYTLKASFLGYQTVEIQFNLTSDTQLQNIILKENLETLDDVTIIAKKPTVNRMVDRLVFNVENSTLSNNNVLDVLKHTPGVLVYNGDITIKNATPTIYINDRKVHLSTTEVMQLLEGTSAGNLKSVEVITNPPAKYEAEGGAVINIITTKNIAAGYNGSVFGSFKQGSEYPKYSYGTSHFFKTKKLSAYINFSDNPKKEFRHNQEYITFFDDIEETATSWETDLVRTRKTSNKSINTNIDYTINANNSIGFSTNMLIAPRERTKNYINSATKVFNTNNELDSLFITEGRLVDETFNLAFTLDYKHQFKRAGEELSVSLHRTCYDFSSFQNVDTDYLYPDYSLIRDNRFQTFSSQVVDLNTGQLDYVLPINESSVFEAGGKVSIISSESIVTQYRFNNDVKEEDLDNSDTFLYDENNYAAYVSYSKDWDSWSLKTGFRLEYTDIIENSLTTSQEYNNNYLKLFPTIHVLNSINENNEVYFNYKKRIYRPRYSQLNPFKYYLNDNAYIIGDPFLKPQIDDVFTLGYTFYKDFTLEAYYRIENDPTQEIVFQDNENNILKYSQTNIDKSISYGLDFITYTQIAKKWNVYLLTSVFYYENQFFALESNNELVTLDKWSFYGQLINYFTFLKDNSLTADVSYLFISPFASGASITSERSGLNINLKKTFWNNRASLSVGVTDIFNNQNFDQKTKYLNQNIIMNSNMENRLLTFGFNYKFGNFKLQTNKKDIDLIERDRLN
ncbi:outer membrane beta-barrel protein [Seonamhaeicola sp.]|uniref:outer membrane beta-barrel protein n=1 Tax=Seonamhaeicola sp. TaxID=1912245 RepID=UPI003564DDA1